MTARSARQRQQSIVIRHQKIERVGASERLGPRAPTDKNAKLAPGEFNADAIVPPRSRLKPVQGRKIRVHAIFEQASRRIEFYNGKLDCRLLEYLIYDGSKREPKTD